MSKDEKDLMANVPKAGTPAPMTTEELTRMLIQTQRELADSQNKMAEAILESRKPYVDPKVLEAKKRELDDRRRTIEMDQANRVAVKKICPHTRENGTPNIKWMQHSNNIILGVCGTCRSEFDARNPDDLKLLRMDLKSQKNMGRAGSHAMRGAILTA